MIYILKAHVGGSQCKNYFLGVYTDKKQALAEKSDREMLYGKRGYFVDEYTTGGRLLHVNIKD